MTEQNLLKTLRRVRRRLMAMRAAETGLCWAVRAAGLAVVLVGCAALLYSALPGRLAAFYPYGPLAVVPAALVIGALVRLARPIRLRDAAVYLDRQADLEERVATAYELMRAGNRGALTPLVLAQADEVCRKFRPGMIRYSRRLGREARYLVVGLVACGAVLFVPPLKTQAFVEEQDYRAHRREAIEELTRAMERIEPKQLEGDEELQELMREMERTAETLRNSALAPERDLAEMARLKSEFEKERARREAERELRDKVREARKTAGMAQELGEAGRGQRRKLAEKMAEGSLSPEEERAMRRVADAAAKAADAAGDRKLAESAARVLDAVRSGEGSAESLSEDLENVAEASRRAAGRGSGEAQAREEKIARAIEAIDRAKRTAAGQGGGSTAASGGQPGKGSGAGQGSAQKGGGGRHQTCPACGGSGKTASGKSCPTCNGTGVVRGGRNASAGSGSTNLDRGSGPGGRSEQEEVNPEREWARIYRSRSIEHQNERKHVSGILDPQGPSAGKVTIRGGAAPDERARLTFRRSLEEAAKAREEAIEETRIPADMKDLVRRYFTPDAD